MPLGHGSTAGVAGRADRHPLPAGSEPDPQSEPNLETLPTGPLRAAHGRTRVFQSHRNPHPFDRNSELLLYPHSGSIHTSAQFRRRGVVMLCASLRDRCRCQGAIWVSASSPEIRRHLRPPQRAMGWSKVEIRTRLRAPDPNRIIITELAYPTTTASSIASIETAVSKGRVKIATIHDYTTDRVEIVKGAARESLHCAR